MSNDPFQLSDVAFDSVRDNLAELKSFIDYLCQDLQGPDLLHLPLLMVAVVYYVVLQTERG